MYVEIEDGELISWCENQYADYKYVDIDYSTFKPKDYEYSTGFPVSIVDTQKYKKDKRLQEIQDELKQVTTDYEAAMETPIEFTNGFTYKPSYANDTYSGLILAEMVAQQANSSIFPKLIKDSTKLTERAIEMTYSELVTLSLFLTNKAEALWQEKAAKEAAVLAEKETLQN